MNAIGLFLLATTAALASPSLRGASLDLTSVNPLPQTSDSSEDFAHPSPSANGAPDTRDVGRDGRVPSAESEEDQETVDAAISGDLQAFVALYDRYSERVYRYVYYYVGNQADAEDVTQEVFLRAWKGIGRYRRTGAKFVSWLLTIAHNTRLDAFRPGRETRELDDIDCPAPTRWSDPEAEALAESDRLAVRRGILRLKPDQQRVITMHFLEHLEYAEIAAALGKSEGNVRVIQLRALVSLRRLLADEVAA